MKKIRASTSPRGKISIGQNDNLRLVTRECSMLSWLLHKVAAAAAVLRLNRSVFLSMIHIVPTRTRILILVHMPELYVVYTTLAAYVSTARSFGWHVRPSITN